MCSSSDVPLFVSIAPYIDRHLSMLFENRFVVIIILFSIPYTSRFDLNVTSLLLLYIPPCDSWQFVMITRFDDCAKITLLSVWPFKHMFKSPFGVIVSHGFPTVVIYVMSLSR